MKSCLFWGGQSWVYPGVAVCVQDGGRLCPMELSTGPLASWVEPLASPHLFRGTLMEVKRNVSFSGESEFSVYSPVSGHQCHSGVSVSSRNRADCMDEVCWLELVLPSLSCLLLWIVNSPTWRQRCGNWNGPVVFLQDGFKPQSQWCPFPSLMHFLFLPDRGMVGVCIIHSDHWHEWILLKAGDCSDWWFMQKWYRVVPRTR